MDSCCVVKTDDIVVDVVGGLHRVGIVALPEPLHFEVEEEALNDGVIPAVALAAHAGDEAVSGQQGAVCLTGVLAAAVGVEDESGRGFAQVKGHLQGGANEFCGHARGTGPADDFAVNTGPGRRPGTASRCRCGHR